MRNLRLEFKGNHNGKSLKYFYKTEIKKFEKLLTITSNCNSGVSQNYCKLLTSTLINTNINLNILRYTI